MRYRVWAAGFAGRVIVYAGLGALVAGVFLGIVLALGNAMHLSTPHPGLTLAATVLLAVAFDPARGWLQRLANRVVFGHRRSPWEAVRHLAIQMGHDRDPIELLRELCGVVQAGTGARTVVVWLRMEPAWVPIIGTPDIGARGLDPGAAVTQLPGADLAVDIRHSDQILGAITVTKSGRNSLSSIEERLVTDLASHAGIVTRTLHLRESLRRRLEASRQQQLLLSEARARVVAAQDDERRRLERDLHDSCQQQAVILAGRLGLAGALARRDPARAHSVLDEIDADLTRLASALRRLLSARPMPELVSDGIGPALRVASIGLPVSFTIDDALVGRYPLDVEATAYFCAMEAIQNATKHARASRIQVSLSEATGLLAVRVRDDGVGFDVERAHAGTGLRNIRERLRPWRGRLVIHSSSTGTELTVEIPQSTHEAP